MINPYFDGWVKIIQGDALKVLAEMPEESVQCVVTSPPYWGLRKYSGEQEIVWGDNHCEHRFDMPTSATIGSNTLWRPDDDTGLLVLPAIDGKWGETQRGGVDRQRKEQVGNFCSLCGAWRGAYGLEPTPEMYVEHTIEFLRAIRRVLRKDGCIFWNIGDAYSATRWTGKEQGQAMNKFRDGYRDINPDRSGCNLPAKNLCLIPFRVAIAAQEDGWWVRSVIIWSKLNPMPESVKDRPTESHEYILLLTKQANYYWDMEAVREPNETINELHYPSRQKRIGDNNFPISDGRNRFGCTSGWNPSGRNLRSVWTFATEPYPGAHFATFPRELPKRCILAASKEGDIILDPFSGSGTVGEVAKSLGRKAILIDISAEYCKLAQKRVEAVSLPLKGIEC